MVKKVKNGQYSKKVKKVKNVENSQQLSKQSIRSKLINTVKNGRKLTKTVNNNQQRSLWSKKLKNAQKRSTAVKTEKMVKSGQQPGVEKNINCLRDFFKTHKLSKKVCGVKC